MTLEGITDSHIKIMGEQAGRFYTFLEKTNSRSLVLYRAAKSEGRKIGRRKKKLTLEDITSFRKGRNSDITLYQVLCAYMLRTYLSHNHKEKVKIFDDAYALSKGFPIVSYS
jgi:hypothetical protein